LARLTVLGSADKLVVSPSGMEHMETITSHSGWQRQDVPKGTTAYDVAKGISPRLADAAFVAKFIPATVR